jgi:asparagine synthase (glutamine-hydrolysing)
MLCTIPVSNGRVSDWDSSPAPRKVSGMCGIAGVVDLKYRRSVPQDVLAGMAQAIVHRGPDEEGFFHAPGIGLASRRLSIVGLADGQQPIFNEDRSLVTVYNGELFDHVERREELQARGHRFRTHADTEIIPHLYEDHGDGLLDHLRGQFAFCLFDSTRHRVLLARDHFGICPLYWTRASVLGNDWLLFASEIKALLASGLIEPRPDPRGIDSLFNFLAIPGPMSCFEGINHLLPGRALSVELGRDGADARIDERTYWEIDFPRQGEEERGQSVEQVVDGFEDVLRASIKRRLRADVPVASYLSGGVDSGVVVALARDVLGKAPATFTIKIKDEKLDETAEAAQTSRHVGTEPFIVECGSEEIVANYQKLLLAAESPVTDTSCTALKMLAGRVKQEGYKVALTGEGGDEWLAGYPWFKFNRVLDRIGRATGGLASDAAMQGLGKWLGFDERAIRHAALCERSSGGPHAYLNFYHLLNVSRSTFYSKGMHGCLEGHDPYAVLEPDLARVREMHPLNRGLYWGGRIHLAGQLLSLKGDRIAMSQSVEMRYPFLDIEVFSYLAGLDPDLKLRGLREKYLLRRLAERWLPKEIAWRPKGMFRAPLDGFFQASRLPYVDQLLSRESLQQTGYFDPERVEKWKRDYVKLSGVLYKRSSMELGLVAVLATQLWHHTFIDSSLCELPDWSSLAGVAPVTDAAAQFDAAAGVAATA